MKFNIIQTLEINDMDSMRKTFAHPAVKESPQNTYRAAMASIECASEIFKTGNTEESQNMQAYALDKLETILDQLTPQQKEKVEPLLAAQDIPLDTNALNEGPEQSSDPDTPGDLA